MSFGKVLGALNAALLLVFTCILAKKPNRPVIEVDEEGSKLKLFINKNEDSQNLFVQVYNNSGWTTLGKFKVSKKVKAEESKWITFPLDCPGSERFRVKKVLENGTSVYSQPAHKAQSPDNEHAASVTDINNWKPNTPKVAWSHNNTFKVEWKMPNEKLLSEDYVLVVETGKKKKWKQTREEFSDGDEDGVIRMTIDTMDRFLKVKVLDVDYNFSKESTPLDLRKIKLKSLLRRSMLGLKTVSSLVETYTDDVDL